MTVTFILRKIRIYTCTVEPDAAAKPGSAGKAGAQSDDLIISGSKNTFPLISRASVTRLRACCETQDFRISRKV